MAVDDQALDDYHTVLRGMRRPTRMLAASTRHALTLCQPLPATSLGSLSTQLTHSSGPRNPPAPAVIKDFCKQLGADTKQVQGLIRLAKKNGEKLGFLA